MKTEERKQWHHIKGWLRKNSWYLVLVGVLMIGSLSGWSYWKQSQYNHEVSASILYEAMLSSAEADNLPEARQKLTELEKLYKDTAYPFFGNLYFSKHAYRLEQTQMAKEALRWITYNTEDELFLQMAIDRLGRLLLDDNKPKEAIQVMNEMLTRLVNTRKIANLNMLIGDAHLQLGQVEAAIHYYQSGIQSLNSNNPSALRELLEEKIRNFSSL